MSRKLWNLAIVLGGCLSLGCGSEDAPSVHVFRFQPPDGLELLQHMTVERVQEMPGRPRLVDHTESVSRFTIERSGVGYAVFSSQVSFSARRNGEELDNPLSTLLQSMPAILELDGDGRLLSIRGFEKVSERIAAELPPEWSEIIGSVLTEDLLVRRGRQEWDTRYERFIGRKLTQGQLWSETSQVEVSGDEPMTRYGFSSLVGVEPCGERTCVRIRTLFDNDLEALRQHAANTFGTSVADLPPIETESSLASPSSRYSVDISRLIDPETLLPHDEEQLREIQKPVEGGDVSITETRRYRFEYGG